MKLSYGLRKEHTPKVKDFEPPPAGYHDGPCGWTKATSVTHLYPPGHEKKLAGADDVYEYDAKENIINQWSIPVMVTNALVEGI